MGEQENIQTNKQTCTVLQALLLGYYFLTFTEWGPTVVASASSPQMNTYKDFQVKSPSPHKIPSGTSFSHIPSSFQLTGKKYS